MTELLNEVRDEVNIKNPDFKINRLGFVTRTYFYGLCKVLNRKLKPMSFEEVAKNCPDRQKGYCNGQNNNGFRVQCNENNCANYYFYKLNRK